MTGTGIWGVALLAAGLVPIAPSSVASVGSVPASTTAASHSTLPAIAMVQSGAARSRRDMREDFARCTGRPDHIPVATIRLIEACDRALADPPGEGAGWERQVAILHNKAIWQYAGGQIADAIATLDRADAAAAGQRSVVHEISTGLASTMLRALLYHRSNRQPEALALLDQARTVRPWSLSAQKAIDRLELRISGDNSRLQALTSRHLATDPATAQGLFYQHLFDGDYAAAAAMGELARFGRPVLIGGWTLDGKDPELEDLIEEIKLRYAMAYVRAALGDDAGAEAQFAGVEQRLNAYVGPEPVPTANRRAVRPELVQAWQARGLRADEQRLAAPHWRAAIALRAELIAGADQSVLNELRFQSVRNLAVSIDILRVVAQTHPDQRAEIEQILQQNRSEGLRDLIEMTPAQAVHLLPESETLASYPRFGRAGDGIMIGREAGYSQAPQRDGDIRTIRFGTLSGTGATADELVMLAAATYAQREGVDSFLIVGRHLLQRRTNITGYYGGTSVSDSGSEGAVLAVLIDSNAVPPQWEAHRSRLIRVADIMASVGARQTVIEAQKAAQAR